MQYYNKQYEEKEIIVRQWCCHFRGASQGDDTWGEHWMRQDRKSWKKQVWSPPSRANLKWKVLRNNSGLFLQEKNKKPCVIEGGESEEQESMIESEAEARPCKGFSRVINPSRPAKVNSEERFSMTEPWRTAEFGIWDPDEHTAAETQEWALSWGRMGRTCLSHSKYLKKDESPSVPNSPARLRKARIETTLCTHALHREQFSDVVETEAACSWFEREYDMRTLGQRRKYSQENERWRNRATEGWARKGRIVFPGWEILHHTCKKDRRMGQMESVTGRVSGRANTGEPWSQVRWMLRVSGE